MKNKRGELMLKIKDNVNLKELENYGFKQLFYASVGTVYKKEITRGVVINNYVIDSKNKIIHYNQMAVHNELDNTLYDLIKDGLVEKVENSK